jgi:hypothetical protein
MRPFKTYATPEERAKAMENMEYNTTALKLGAAVFMVATGFIGFVVAANKLKGEFVK